MRATTASVPMTIVAIRMEVSSGELKTVGIGHPCTRTSHGARSSAERARLGPLPRAATTSGSPTAAATSLPTLRLPSAASAVWFIPVFRPPKLVFVAESSFRHSERSEESWLRGVSARFFAALRMTDGQFSFRDRYKSVCNRLFHFFDSHNRRRSGHCPHRIVCSAP